MLNSLLRRKNPLNKRIVWGIWAPRSLQLAYKALAAQLRVPMSVLVGHVLDQWLAQNGEVLVKDPEARQKYGDDLAKRYLTSHEKKD